jgi:iron-sulfur cluster protein
MINTAQDLPEYKKRLKRALDNKFLRHTLAAFAAAYPEGRARALTGVDFEALRGEIIRGKDEALPRLEELYAAFKARAEAAGAKVHLAKTAREANEIIAAIAKEAGAKKIVKSKSMTAEETFLNDHLEEEGLEVVETDLGEWIIQLRREGPSHMVMPAIHLSRQEVAELFSQVTGESQDPEDIGKLVKVARREMRKAFLEADMGISGANFALADTGTLGIMTNEGNGRLVTALPRIHVALVGLDKLVPDLASALKILKVLPKNATGQVITSYVTWITGATECKAAPAGLKDLHIVFLDNGRLALSRDPIFAEALRCIRCGACANVCPIYGLVGGHNYGHVYIGAIGLILTYFYHGRKNDRAIVQNCLNCLACKAVCPAGINLPLLIKQVHGEILAEGGDRPLKNRLLRRVLHNRRLFHFLLRRASLAQKPFAREGFIRHLPFFFGKEHEFRSLPAIVRTPLRDRWDRVAGKVAQPRLKVALFAGCLVDFVYPEQGEALVQLLKEHQVQVDFPMDQSCCGLPAKCMGEMDLAKEMAIQNLKAVDPAEYDHVLVLCASCGSHIKGTYPRLLAQEPGLGVKVRQLAEKLVDFSSFMTEVLKVQPEEFLGRQEKVAYHAPCHLCRGLQVTRPPRDLLTIAGYEYVPAKNEEVCCGMGGTFSTDFPELSAELLKNKLDGVAATGAELLVTDCPGCVLQLKGGMDKRGGKIRVKHLAEAVAETRKRGAPGK